MFVLFIRGAGSIPSVCMCCICGAVCNGSKVENKFSFTPTLHGMTIKMILILILLALILASNLHFDLIHLYAEHLLCPQCRD